MFSKLLVPLDGSKMAENALDYARHLARQNDSVIHLVHVSAAGWIVGDVTGFGGYPIPQAILDTEVESQTAYLAKIKADLEADKLTVFVHATQGEPSMEILDLADKHSCDLIVLTSHGRTGLNRFLIGSVAERIARHASCPVMIVGRASVKAKDAAAQLV